MAVLVFLGGCALGALVGALLGRTRSTGLLIAYALVVAGAVWAVAGIIAGNRAEEMAAIPYLVAGGMAFWFVVVPAGVAVVIGEYRRSRGRSASR